MNIGGVVIKVVLGYGGKHHMTRFAIGGVLLTVNNIKHIS